MTCKEVHGVLGGLVFDELDVERRREVEQHLESCEVCREKREALVRTLSALRALPQEKSSSARRAKTVAAMKEEHTLRVETLALAGPRQAWRWIAMAASVLVLLGGAAFLAMSMMRIEIDLRVLAVEGDAKVLRDGETEWKPLSAETLVRHGDRIVSHGTVRMVIRYNGTPSGTVGLPPDTSLQFFRSNRERSLILDRGELRLADISGEVHVRSPSGDELVIREGTVDITSRQTVGLVMAYKEKRPEPMEGADLKFVEQPLAEVCARISELAGKRIRSFSEAKVTFYGHSSGEDLIGNFRRTMEDQGLAVLEDGEEIIVLHSLYRVQETAQRMVARVSSGEARLVGTKGAVILEAGQEGAVGVEGVPSIRAFEADSSDGTAGPSLRLPKVRLLAVGRDFAGRPLLQCAWDATEFPAELQGKRIIVSVEGGAPQLVRDGDALEIEVKLRFETR